ncbi:hypothetical protein BDW22DRAFT_224605 [Trametopsis cervina]|nr:hypothetical protein BDW22DRAFT_224605 [Trametopsis cervina]
MSLTNCPIEIVEHIADFFVSDAQRLSSFIATCRYTYYTFHHLLYRSITCKTDQSAALCCQTLADSQELCELVQEFVVFGPQRIVHGGEDRRDFVGDFAKALMNMTNLRVLNCDISFCSLEVCIALSNGNFPHLQSLALRITDHSVPVSRSIHQLQDLQPHLPNLKRLLIRDNTHPSYAKRFIQCFIQSSQHSLRELMLSCWYDSGNLYLQSDNRCTVPEWRSLETLTIRRDAFNVNILRCMPQIRRLTLLRDYSKLQPLPDDILPNLEHIGCAIFNLNAFLPTAVAGRPIRSVKLDAVSPTGTYHGPRNQPTRSSLRAALSHLAHSSVPIESLATPIRMLYAEYFPDVTPFISELQSLVIYVVHRAPVQTGHREVRNGSN